MKALMKMMKMLMGGIQEKLMLKMMKVLTKMMKMLIKMMEMTNLLIKVLMGGIQEKLICLDVEKVKEIQVIDTGEDR